MHASWAYDMGYSDGITAQRRGENIGCPLVWDSEHYELWREGYHDYRVGNARRRPEYVEEDVVVWTDDMDINLIMA